MLKDCGWTMMIWGVLRPEGEVVRNDVDVIVVVGRYDWVQLPLLVRLVVEDSVPQYGRWVSVQLLHLLTMRTRLLLYHHLHLQLL